MKSKESGITRRDFIKGTGCVAMGMALGLPAVAEEIVSEPVKKARVVLIRDKDVVTAEGKIDGEIIQRMFDEGISALFENKNVADCWRQVVKPEDVVGIKTNEWGPLRTPAAVEQAIKRRVLEAGAKEENIAIADRGVREHPVFKKATALINTRPMRTHAWSGVGSLIKNYIPFVSYPPDYHPDSCADLGAVWQLPIVKDKTRLNVLVMLTPLFYGVGPHHFDTTYVWRYGGLLIGADPVAVDTIGLQIFQAKRKAYFGENRPIQPTAHHIAFADTRHGLGVSDPALIDLVRLGWEEDSLI